MTSAVYSKYNIPTRFTALLSAIKIHRIEHCTNNCFNSVVFAQIFFYLNNGGRIVTDLARNANVLMQFFQFHSYKSSDLLFFFNWITLGRGPAHYAQPVGDLPSNTSHDTIDWAIRSKPDERNRESCLPHHEPTSSSEKNCAICDRNPRMTDCYMVTHSPALTSRRGRQHDRSHKPREIRAPKTCWNIFVRHE